MNRLDHITQNGIFRSTLLRLEEQERDRKYCRHGLPHLLDVARAAYILSLERQTDIAQDVIYAAALLHDIGRSVQYATGEPHERAGVPIAEDILRDTEYTADEKEMILSCVRSHHHSHEGQNALQALICEADKRSRPCFACKMLDTCKWSEEQRNMSLTI